MKEETVDLCSLQILNGATEVIKPHLPMTGALAILDEEQRAQVREQRYGFGVMLFLRPSDDLFAAVSKQMRLECRDVPTPYDSYYHAMKALQDVWRLVANQSGDTPRVELRQALVHLAAQALCAIEELEL